MSWDILLLDLPVEVRSVSEIPEDFVPQPICSRVELLAKVSEALPGVDFSDPAWGHIAGPGFSIELNVGDSEKVMGVMLHVRGGDGALAVVKHIADSLSVRAIDCSEGELLDFSTPRAEASLRAWRAYRDRVVGGSGESE